ncbi:hypothetical protein T06_12285 [Trichinella sp. T6]|nr:hypothetical protein T06_12285 [Trichinella sp. T6]
MESELSEIKNRRSGVWKHFWTHKNDSLFLKCRHCKREFTEHSSTTSLRCHVTRVHSLRHDDYEAGSFNQNNKNAKSGPSILTLLKAEHVYPKLCLAKLVVLDRIPFRVFAKSTEIQKVWIARGLKIPATEKGMKERDGPTGAQLYSHSGPLFIYWSLSSLFY